MLHQEVNLLERVRVITITLVTIIGFGTIAMKPAVAPFDHIYGVAETADGTHWEIKADVTSPTSVDYECTASQVGACIIGSNSVLNKGDEIPINTSQVIRAGLFQQF